jgi:hypothetical protein
VCKRLKEVIKSGYSINFNHLEINLNSHKEIMELIDRVLGCHKLTILLKGGAVSKIFRSQLDQLEIGIKKLLKNVENNLVHLTIRKENYIVNVEVLQHWFTEFFEN